MADVYKNGALQSGQTIQQVLDGAVLGDTVQLDPNGTFAEHWSLPNKGDVGDPWPDFHTLSYAQQDAFDPGEDCITIEPLNFGSAALASVRDVVPATHEAAMPVCMNSITANIVTSAQGAKKYVLRGFKLTADADVNQLIQLGSDSEVTLANQPRDVFIDRVLIRGKGGTSSHQSGARVEVNNVFFRGPWIGNIYRSQDTQAILTINAGGPLVVRGGYLEAAGENFMSGGGGNLVGQVPTGVRFSQVHFKKPIEWWWGHPSHDGVARGCKNLFETKYVDDLLIDGCFFENSFAQGQDGTGILFGHETYYDGAYEMVRNQKVRNSVIKNVLVPFGQSYQHVDIAPCGPYEVTNVLCDVNLDLLVDVNGNPVDPEAWSGFMHLTAWSSAAFPTAGASPFEHIGFYLRGSTATFGARVLKIMRVIAENSTNGYCPGVRWRSHLFDGADAGFIGMFGPPGNESAQAGGPWVNHFCSDEYAGTPDYTATHNFGVEPTNSGGAYAAAEGAVTYAASQAAFRANFRNYGTDYQLTAESAYRNAGHDGTDAGPNLATIYAAMGATLWAKTGYTVPDGAASTGSLLLGPTGLPLLVNGRPIVTS